MRPRTEPDPCATISPSAWMGPAFAVVTVLGRMPELPRPFPLPQAHFARGGRGSGRGAAICSSAAKNLALGGGRWLASQPPPLTLGRQVRRPLPSPPKGRGRGEPSPPAADPLGPSLSPELAGERGTVRTRCHSASVVLPASPPPSSSGLARGPMAPRGNGRRSRQSGATCADHCNHCCCAMGPRHEAEDDTCVVAAGDLSLSPKRISRAGGEGQSGPRACAIRSLPQRLQDSTRQRK